ncbi:hypothetical protein [Acidithiobacillus ferridurans]|uniref:Uncharacterized protein n=1 Tax=Acidithiobacillus ferridurans TaxID=1232575 RepID=A0A8X8G6C2_ACIFI|nr:hypothetical protein [Acidithiobacillus ferridurans]MBU2715580.1 hypothetical protein [Acidithiobacillus ferridurans]MBU2722930.1 hypothetical protein [Acidithiobacillus ferridurans]MBU2728178.1 hypothetical protein [Acidithiobacillus ferridurans]
MTKYTHLPADAVEWLCIGEHGLSSAALFYHTTGFLPKTLDGWSKKDYSPFDPSDLRRCRLVYDDVALVRERFYVMANVSTMWAWLVEHWDDICRTMDEECPQWRDRLGTANETYRKMHGGI